jgi:two-component sensor histidine kinase
LITSVIRDLTPRLEVQERQVLLIRELNHRVKNTLAIVQGLAMQSFRRIEGSEQAQQTFNARLAALAGAHSLLTGRDWKAGRLSDILRSSVEATAGQDAERIDFDGPDVMLPPQLAVSLAMIVHELSTNAIKYGSLSRPGGRVAVRWTIQPGESARTLRIEWTESGGPPVDPPTRRGFGTRLIERGVTGDSGRVAIDYAAEGLRCTMEFSLAEDEE